MPCKLALKVLAPGPIASVASLTLIAIVRLSLPLLKEVSARPTVAPWSVRGPSAIGCVDVPDAGESLVTVKLATPGAPASVPPLFGSVSDHVGVDVPGAVARNFTS